MPPVAEDMERVDESEEFHGGQEGAILDTQVTTKEFPEEEKDTSMDKEELVIHTEEPTSTPTSNPNDASTLLESETSVPPTLPTLEKETREPMKDQQQQEEEEQQQSQRELVEHLESQDVSISGETEPSSMPILSEEQPTTEEKTTDKENRRSLSRPRRSSHRYDQEFETIKDVSKSPSAKALTKEQVNGVDDSEKRRGGMGRELLKFCSNTIRLLKKHRDAWPFQVPVDPVNLGIPDYFDIIKKPMDLATIEKKLTNLEYSTAQDFINDTRLIFTNCYLYNPPNSDVVVMAQNLEKAFDAQVSRMPNEEQPVMETPSEEVEGETTKGKPKRKRSVDATDSAERKPRRPHTPKSPTSSHRKTKLNSELRFCLNLWKELTSKKSSGDAWPFMEPVDYVKLNLTDYPEIVKHPMDLSTIKKKLDEGIYTSAAEFAADMNLMFSNCYLYNTAESDVVAIGKRLQKSFEEKFAQMLDFLKKLPSSDVEGVGDGDVMIDGDDRDARIRELERHLLDAQSQLESLRKTRKPGERSSSSRPVSRKPSTTGGAASSSHKPKKSAYDLDEVDVLRPMTFDEKRQLSIDIGRLPTDRLDKVVEIIQKYSPLTKGDESNEIEVDIDALDTRALRHLESYVQSVLGKKQAAPRKPKPSTTAATSRRPEARPANVQTVTQADLSSSSTSSSYTSSSSSDSGSDND